MTSGLHLHAPYRYEDGEVQDGQHYANGNADGLIERARDRDLLSRETGL
jgi:hypothetical protein